VRKGRTFKSPLRSKLLDRAMSIASPEGGRLVVHVPKAKADVAHICAVFADVGLAATHVIPSGISERRGCGSGDRVGMDGPDRFGWNELAYSTSGWVSPTMAT